MFITAVHSQAKYIKPVVNITAATAINGDSDCSNWSVSKGDLSDIEGLETRSTQDLSVSYKELAAEKDLTETIVVSLFDNTDFVLDFDEHNNWDNKPTIRPVGSVISFLLADNSSIELKNGREDEGWSKESVYFKANATDKAILLRLSTINVVKLSLWNDTSHVDFVFDTATADKFRMTVKCISGNLVNDGTVDAEMHGDLLVFGSKKDLRK